MSSSVASAFCLNASSAATVVFSGDYAKSMSIDGAIIYERLRNNTIAHIEDRAVVEAGRDVNVGATADAKVYSIAPAVAIGGSKGVGIGVAISELDGVTPVAFRKRKERAVKRLRAIWRQLYGA